MWDSWVGYENSQISLFFIISICDDEKEDASIKNNFVETCNDIKIIDIDFFFHIIALETFHITPI